MTEKLQRGAIYPGEAYKGRFSSYVWDGKPARPPRKGEWYLSGAYITAYRAPSDLTTPYHIAVEVELTTCPCCNGHGKIIRNTKETD